MSYDPTVDSGGKYKIQTPPATVLRKKGRQGLDCFLLEEQVYDNLVDEEDGLLLLAVESEGEDGLGWIDDLTDGAGESEHVAIRILGIHHHLCANLKHSDTLFIIWS